jgi:hypothetical protein
MFILVVFISALATGASLALVLQREYLYDGVDWVLTGGAGAAMGALFFFLAGLYGYIVNSIWNH